MLQARRAIFLLDYMGEFVTCLPVLQTKVSIAVIPVPPTVKTSFFSTVKYVIRALKTQVFHSARFIYSELLGGFQR